MCGLAGFFNPDTIDTEGDMLSQLARMSDAIVHRGPDSHGLGLMWPAELVLLTVDWLY